MQASPQLDASKYSYTHTQTRRNRVECACVRDVCLTNLLRPRTTQGHWPLPPGHYFNFVIIIHLWFGSFCLVIMLNFLAV